MKPPARTPQPASKPPSLPKAVPAWTARQGLLLQSLREAAGWDEAVFAKNHTISTAQLRALEGRGYTPFYSEAIKTQLGRRLLESLGHREREPEPPAGAGEEQAAAAKVPAQAEAAPHTVVTAPLRAPEAIPTPTFEARPAPASFQAPKGHDAPGRRTSPLLALGATAALVLTLGLGWTLWTDAQGTAGARLPTQIAEAPVAFVASGAQAEASTHASNATDAADASTARADAAPTVAAEASSNALPANAPALTPPAFTAEAIARASAPPSTFPAGPCGWSRQTQAVTYTPERGLKPASYVHVEAVEPARLCLVDARQQIVEVELRPGEARSFPGTPPFLVQSSNPQGVRLFFQGLRVPGATLGPNGVVLQALAST